MKNVLLAAAVALVLAGGGVFYGSMFAKNFISDQLSAQKITFSTKEALVKEGREDLVKYAGQQLTTGDQAKAYASYIQGHLAKVANGKTYSEVSADFQKDKTNQTLAGQRTTLFMGETLRGILLNTWGWGLIGTIAFYGALGLWAAAIALLAIYVLMNRTVTKRPVAKSKKKKK
jgi:hypothetical protein